MACKYGGISSTHNTNTPTAACREQSVANSGGLHCIRVMMCMQMCIPDKLKAQCQNVGGREQKNAYIVQHNTCVMRNDHHIGHHHHHHMRLYIYTSTLYATAMLNLIYLLDLGKHLHACQNSENEHFRRDVRLSFGSIWKYNKMYQHLSSCVAT